MPDAYLIDLSRGPVLPADEDAGGGGALVPLLDDLLLRLPTLAAHTDELLVGSPELGQARAEEAVLASGLQPSTAAVSLHRAGAGGDLALTQAVFGIASGYRRAAVVVGVGASAPAMVGADWPESARWRYTPTAPAVAAGFCALRAELDQDRINAEQERRLAERNAPARGRLAIGPLPGEPVGGRDRGEAACTVWPGAVEQARPADVGGAALAVLAESDLLRAEGWTARARIASVETVAGDPAATWHRPVDAALACLNRVQLRADELHLVQVDTPCGALPLAVAGALGLPVDQVNAYGDACDSGRAPGAAAILSLLRLVHALEAQDQRFGLLLTTSLSGQATAFLVDREFYL